MSDVGAGVGPRGTPRALACAPACASSPEMSLAPVHAARGRPGGRMGPSRRAPGDAARARSTRLSGWALGGGPRRGGRARFSGAPPAELSTKSGDHAGLRARPAKSKMHGQTSAFVRARPPAPGVNPPALAAGGGRAAVFPPAWSPSGG
jgi:hypothetical protein